MLLHDWQKKAYIDIFQRLYQVVLMRSGTNGKFDLNQLLKLVAFLAFRFVYTVKI